MTKKDFYLAGMRKKSIINVIFKLKVGFKIVVLKNQLPERLV